MKKEYLTHQDKEYIINTYPHKGISFCQNHLNKNRWSIIRFCHLNNIKCTKECIASLLKEAAIKANITKSKKIWIHKVDEKQFMDVRTPESAYLLGLLWADGFLTRQHQTSIICLRDDLESIEHIFNKTGKWTKYYIQRLNRKPALNFTTCNKDLVSFLKENDYHCKSEESADKILSIIPDELKRYWFLGLIDGDGCFYVGKTGAKQFSVASSYNQNWNYIINLFKKLDINIYKISRINKEKSKSSIIRMSNPKEIIKLINYIYPNGYEFGFKRKFDKAMLIYKI